MNSWSSHRKFIVSLIILALLVVLIGVPLYLYFHQTPTCFDGKLNGTESGVDCGGACKIMCTSEALPLLMKGDPRVIQVTPTTYDVVANVQNPNLLGEVLHAGYTFKVYDATSTEPIKTVTGNTYIPKNSSFGIFVGPMSFIDIVPTRVTFSWDAPLVWDRNDAAAPQLQVTNPLLTQVSGKPRLTATLTNNALTPVGNIELVAFVQDENGNTIGASKTIVDSLSAKESAPFIFTWPQNFIGTSTAVVIEPRVFPDVSYRN